MSRQTSTLHFDLSAFSPDLEFRLLTGRVKGGIPLQRYADAPSKLDEHRAGNPALALIPEANSSSITHFLEAVDLSARGIAMHRVVHPSIDDHPLPELAMVFFHIGGDDIMHALHRLPAYQDERPHHLALATYGVAAEETFGDYAAVHIGAANIKPPGVTAQSLVLNHPEIGSANGVVTKYVLDKYVSSGIPFSELVAYIQRNGPGTDDQWYNKSWAVWSQNDDGTGPLVPAEVNPDLVFKDGEKPDWPTPPGASAPGIPTYSLTDEYEPPAKSGKGAGVVGAAAPVVQQVLKLTKSDVTLNGLLWSKQDGTTEKSSTNQAPTPVAAAATSPVAGAAPGAAAGSGFAIKNVTSSYGLWLYDDEMAFSYDDKTLTFPVKNWPSRYLGAYVQFLKSDGTPIKRADIAAANPQDPSKPFGWRDKLPFEAIRSFVEPSDTKNYLTWVSSGAAVFGVPTPFFTQKADLGFLWPDDASHAAVLLGGLGVAAGFADWDGDVDIVGVLGTALINYGVGVITMLAGVYVINPLIASFEGDAAIAFYIVCGFFGPVAAILGGITYGTSAGKFILAKLSGIAASVVFGQVSTRLITAGAKAAATAMAEAAGELTGEITAEEALTQVPVAGWALKIASIASDVAGLTATTVEALLSPATYKLDIQRTMDLTVTLSPDPAHGKPGFKPVWPLVSDHYVIQVKYPGATGEAGGTTFTKAGPMPGDHTEPITVVFEGIPAGGKIDVSGNVYSDTNWLAGRWDGGWINALPDAQNQLATAGAIKELLVPLTATTTYSQKQTLAYSNEQHHHWTVTRFTVDAALTADFDKGGAPSAAIVKAFADNGNAIGAGASITVDRAGKQWTLTDAASGVSFAIGVRQIAGGDDVGSGPQWELTVENTTQAAPPLPAVYPLPTGPTGNQLGALQNIIHNNNEYELGYAWMAAGQNLPLDDGDQNQNVPMYAMQSISTLGQPQAQIIEPTRGFTQPTLIAYDQFGLTELFPLDAALVGDLVDGPVPAKVADEFAGFGRTLPTASVVSVVTAGTAWLIGVSGETPLYELRLVTAEDESKHVAVYAYPVPGLDNFYLDPRDHTAANPVYYLRGVKLDQPPGQYTFDYDKSTAWGRIVNSGSLQAMAVHPQGYVVAVDFVNNKLFVLKLPAAAVDSDAAPYAMPLSGEGVREGLMQNPQALTITADGRILILEEGNRRIQAFDVKGNPVSCFSVGQPSFTIARSFAADLDNHDATVALVQAFQQHVTPALAPKFAVSDPGEIVTDLDAGTVDAKLVTAFYHAGYGSDHDVPSDYDVTSTTAGKLWLVTNTKTQATFDVRVLADKYDIDHLYVYSGATLSVTERSKGLDWLVEDTTNSTRYEVTAPADGSDLEVQQVISYMPLREDQTPGLQYLDVAVEPKGYIYVLMVAVAGGTPTFMLDIYNPDGSPLLDHPQSGVNAARLTVDQWRSMFTLNYNVVLGPNGRTEPGVSQWQPSTPVPAGS